MQMIRILFLRQTIRESCVFKTQFCYKYLTQCSKSNVIQESLNTMTIGEGGKDTWKINTLQSDDQLIAKTKKRLPMTLPPPKVVGMCSIPKCCYLC